MGSTSLNQAHKRAREALDATGRPWELTGSRMNYTASLRLSEGAAPLRATGKSQLEAMIELRRRYDAALEAAA